MKKLYNPISPFMFWALSPFLVLFAYLKPSMINEWNIKIFIFIGLWELFIFLIFLKILNPSRFWIAGRLLGFFIFCLYVWYVVSMFIASDWQLTSSNNRSEPSVLNAILGLIFIGLPGIYFAFSGRITYWKGLAQIGKKNTNDSIDDRNPELFISFIKEMKKFLIDNKIVNHDWSIDEDNDHCILQIFKNNKNGFDVLVEVDSFGISVSAAGAHMHLALFEKIDEIVNTTISLVKDFVYGELRIIEYYSNSKPYKWTIERFEENEWNEMETMGLFFWNRFGTKTKKILINKIQGFEKNG